MSIVPIYAALLTLLFVWLSLRVIVLRRRLGVGLGSDMQPLLLRSTRVHANFAEYVPLALLLLAFLELQGRPVWLLHALGLLLMLGRSLHAYGVSQPGERFAFRVSGMAATFTVLLTAATALLIGGA